VAKIAREKHHLMVENERMKELKHIIKESYNDCVVIMARRNEEIRDVK
jgi:hypothetical protein